MSSLIATSNEVDLEVSDFVDYLVDDPNTKVIALYLESVRHPARFREVALRARASRWWCSKLAVPKPVPAQQALTPVPWRVKIGFTMPSSVS
ncbi:hypothetical protein HORIV_65980 [Vreelandella olivaria]|uniref:Succinyl-CoA synthetase-like flavodoxin domain-containing protein n=1 Tax=Vreelandella olivaria TaxID=390919 RepID=A0ABN5X4U3_9GAMM|nr:hypothetical protein HORIV_65980 [Halomonas olivaria]